MPAGMGPHRATPLGSGPGRSVAALPQLADAPDDRGQSGVPLEAVEGAGLLEDRHQLLWVEAFRRLEFAEHPAHRLVPGPFPEADGRHLLVQVDVEAL